MGYDHSFIILYYRDECIGGILTYLITSPPNKCGLRKIKTLSMLTTICVQENRPTEYLVNYDHKLIIRTTETVRDEDCDVCTLYRYTTTTTLK